MEELNARSVRSFAVEQLRRIEASMGIREAGLLADTASKSLSESPRDFVSVASRLTTPLIPSCQDGSGAPHNTTTSATPPHHPLHAKALS